MDRKCSIRLIVRLYGWLQWLYPPGFRKKYAEEQRHVFSESLEDNNEPPGRLFLRELSHLPGVLLRCYWAAFRGGGWQALLKGAAVLFVCLLPGLAFLDQFNIPGNWVGAAVITLLLSAILVGALLGFPRWALPYVGFILPWLLLQFTNDLMNWIGRHLPRLDYSLVPILPRLGLSMFWNIVFLAPILIIVFVALILLRLLPLLLPKGWTARLPNRWRRARRWSDLAFLLYGTVLTFSMIVFDEYRYHQGYSLAASILFLAGAVGFLTARSQRRAVLALLLATTLAFFVISTGKWMVLPLQSWDGWLANHPVETERWFEALSALGTMFTMWFLLLVPLGWRPFIENRSEDESRPGLI